MKPALVRTREWFSRSFAEHGTALETLGWGSKASQERRFGVLCGIGDLRKTSVLDVGCGFGDLSGYLRRRRIECGYLGVDFSPPMVQEARRRHPDARFRQGSLEDLHGRWDYVLASGLHGCREPNPWDVVSHQIRGLYALCRRGIATNFLSHYTTGLCHPDSYYPRPERVLAFALSLTNRCTIRHDYAPNDFTLYMWRPTPYDSGRSRSAAPGRRGGAR